MYPLDLLEWRLSEFTMLVLRFAGGLFCFFSPTLKL